MYINYYTNLTENFEIRLKVVDWLVCLRHINLCGSFNVKPSLYIYINYT